MTLKNLERDLKSIFLEDDNGMVSISYLGTLDLYWNYIPKNAKMQDIDSAVFEIKKSEKVLYPIFLKLYRAIKYSRPFSNSIFEYPDNHKKLAPYYCSDYIGLYKDGVVCWASDDDPIEKANKFEIWQTNTSIMLKFYKGNPEWDRPSFFVRLRNSGSRYHPFNAAFMNNFQALLATFIVDGELK